MEGGARALKRSKDRPSSAFKTSPKGKSILFHLRTYASLNQKADLINPCILIGQVAARALFKSKWPAGFWQKSIEN
jgi:hypothetical protein